MRGCIGKYCYGKTPMQTFNDTKRLALDKIMKFYTLKICLTTKFIGQIRWYNLRCLSDQVLTTTSNFCIPINLV